MSAVFKKKQNKSWVIRLNWEQREINFTSTEAELTTNTFLTLTIDKG